MPIIVVAFILLECYNTLKLISRLFAMNIIDLKKDIAEWTLSKLARDTIYEDTIDGLIVVHYQGMQAINYALLSQADPSRVIRANVNAISISKLDYTLIKLSDIPIIEYN